jgi:hypothetical protein
MDHQTPNVPVQIAFVLKNLMLLLPGHLGLVVQAVTLGVVLVIEVLETVEGSCTPRLTHFKAEVTGRV